MNHMTSSRWRIDVHAHIGHFEGYDLSETTLRSEIDRGEIALALISNIDGAAVEGKTRDLPESVANQATAEAVLDRPDRFRGLLWGRPGSGTPESLEPFRALRVPSGQAGEWGSRVFVGLKLHPEMNHFEIDAPAVDPYMELAGRAGFPVVVHSDGQLDRASPERIVALARRHPGVPVVLYHTAFGGPYRAAIDLVAEALAERQADLYLETAQLPPEHAIEAVERVGAERVLFGTDACYFGVGHYARYQPLVEALEAHCGADDLDAVFRGNALRIFGLHDAPGPLDPPRPDSEEATDD
ncbi:MAG: hypothetical protein EA351_06445 [Gemmatimonadales bacterium]|nr:MAG: hypothetical protein EA351_06445 [Gemmatimonadales bacterium]